MASAININDFLSALTPNQISIQAPRWKISEESRNFLSIAKIGEALMNMIRV